MIKLQILEITKPLSVFDFVGLCQTEMRGIHFCSQMIVPIRHGIRIKEAEFMPAIPAHSGIQYGVRRGTLTFYNSPQRVQHLLDIIAGCSFDKGNQELSFLAFDPAIVVSLNPSS